MNWPVRVLVVDDSALSRRLVTDILTSDPAIQVVGYARNGREALEKVAALQPQVVTLDQEMPVLDGLATLEALMARNPVAVIMFSAHTTAGAEVTLKALELGAVDFVLKPVKPADVQELARVLPEKVKTAARVPVGRLCRGKPCREIIPAAFISPRQDGEDPGATLQAVRNQGRAGSRALQEPRPAAGPWATAAGPVATATDAADGRAGFQSGAGSAESAFKVPVSGAGPSPEIIAIGTSTGGPAALRQVLAALPGDLPAGLVIVQHMPPGPAAGRAFPPGGPRGAGRGRGPGRPGPHRPGGAADAPGTAGRCSAGAPG